MKMLAVSLLVCAVMFLTRAAALTGPTDEPRTEGSIPPDTTLDGGYHHWYLSCPHGWISFDTHCVLYVPEKMTRAGAEENCRSEIIAMPGFLASVSEAGNAERIHEMMKRAGQEHGQVWVRDPKSVESSSWLSYIWSYLDHNDNLINFCHGESAKQENRCLMLTFEGNGSGCLDYAQCDAKLPSICGSILM